MRYKYQKIRSRENPNDIILEPIIPLMLRHGDKKVIVVGLIDSGAELCLFHSSIAKTLGIDLELVAKLKAAMEKQNKIEDRITQKEKPYVRLDPFRSIMATH